ncbi:AAA family ATPase [Persephonella sp.]
MDIIYGQEQALEIIKLAKEKDFPVLLVGETGAGKTSMVQYQANKMGHKAVRFNLTGETTVDEFVGKFVLKKGETVWQDGVLITAMKNGYWLIVDEINAALPEILMTLHSLLDHDKSITLAQNEGEVIKAHKDFRFFATMNPVSEYSGTKELNKAFLSRFPIVLSIEYPNQTTEVKIIQEKTGIDSFQAQSIVQVAVKAREKKLKGDLFYTCSTRDLLYWAEMSKSIGTEKAFIYSIMNKATGEEEEIKKIFEEVFGKIKELEEKAKQAKVATLDINKLENVLKDIIAMREIAEQEIKQLQFERDNMRKIVEKDIKEKYKKKEKELIDKKKELEKYAKELEEKLKTKKDE